MKGDEKILRALGRIEGRLVGIGKIYERIEKLEAWRWWLQGAWAGFVAVAVYLCSHAL